MVGWVCFGPVYVWDGPLEYGCLHATLGQHHRLSLFVLRIVHSNRVLVGLGEIDLPVEVYSRTIENKMRYRLRELWITLADPVACSVLGCGTRLGLCYFSAQEVTFQD